jgi:hypothetical protein
MPAEPLLAEAASRTLPADFGTAAPSISILRPDAPVNPADLSEATALPGRPASSSAVLFLLGTAVLLGSIAVSVRIGVGELGYTEIGRVVGGRLGLPVEPLPGLVDSLVWDLRLPRVLMAAVVGAVLAVCGAVLQTVTRNALADPYLLGVSSGASTGAVVLVVPGAGRVVVRRRHRILAGRRRPHHTGRAAGDHRAADRGGGGRGRRDRIRRSDRPARRPVPGRAPAPDTAAVSPRSRARCSWC